MGLGLDTGKQICKTKIEQALQSAFEATMVEAGGESASNPYISKMANEFAKAAAGDITDAIIDLIKSAKIGGVHTPTALISPMGPVTGAITLLPTDFNLS